MIDIAHRGVDWARMVDWYSKRGIEATHFQIHDFNSEHLTERLKDAAIELNHLINVKGKKVFVHCTAGMGRAPASVISYLIAFKKVSCWQNLVAVAAWVKKYRKVSTPNLGAIGAALARDDFKHL